MIFFLLSGGCSMRKIEAEDITAASTDDQTALGRWTDEAKLHWTVHDSFPLNFTYLLYTSAPQLRASRLIVSTKKKKPTKCSRRPLVCANDELRLQHSKRWRPLASSSVIKTRQEPTDSMTPCQQARRLSPYFIWTDNKAITVTLRRLQQLPL